MVHASIAELLAALRERNVKAPPRDVPLPPALDPVVGALTEMGFEHSTLLAPVTIHAQQDEGFEFVSWLEQPEGPIKIKIEGVMDLGPTDEIVHVEASTELVRKLGGSGSGFECVFGIETTITTRLVLAMRVSRGGSDND